MTAKQDRLQAIETDYAGYRLRSRLEARWAVFFDHVKLNWRYENQGYELKSGFYLPDFEVDMGHTPTYVEVKGDLTSKDLEKPLALCQEYERSVLIVADIPRPELLAPDFFILSPSNYADGYPEATFGCFIPGAQSTVAAVTFGRPKLIQKPRDLFSLLEIGGGIAEMTGWVKRPVIVDSGYRAARSARFEHGQSGARP